MSSIVKKWIPVFIATATGLTVLAGYLIPNSPFSRARSYLVEWAAITAVCALLLGFFNLLRAHGRKLAQLKQGWLYSLVLLLAALVGLATSLLPLLAPTLPASSEQLNIPASWFFAHVLRPLGASLAALLVFTLTLAAFRLLRARRHAGSLLFLLIAILVLGGSTPPPWRPSLLREVRTWIINVPSMAGMRGLLLGVALGTLVTGIRVLMGSDRPHSEF